MRGAREREGGFTIVEVLVATLVLTMGALATFGLLSSATKNTQRAKATQVALDQGQQALEALRGLTYEEVALTATPPHSTSPLNPNYRVNAGAATFALTREPPADYRKLVAEGGSIYGKTGEEGVITGAAVDPGPVHFVSGDVSGDIYSYVVWENDEVCGSDCPGEQDYKQVIVAVKLDTPGNQAGERGYVELKSDFADPTDSSANDPIPNADGDVVTAQQFFLSDTPCAASGTTERQDITGDHLLHNTLGTCGDGPKTGNEEPGAPDALLLGAPPDPAPADLNVPALYDYSDDTYLEPTPDTDRGLQIRLDDTPGCKYVPAGKTNPEAQIHRWVTDPLDADFILTETVTLEFYTRTLNDEPHTGELCVFLFNRHDESPTVAKDSLLVNTVGSVPYWTFTPKGSELWPAGAWERIRLEMTFNGAPYTIPAGDRLGVALGVERSITSPADAIPIMYDHPRYQTRLEVDTSTPIDGG